MEREGWTGGGRKEGEESREGSQKGRRREEPECIWYMGTSKERAKGEAGGRRKEIIDQQDKGQGKEDRAEAGRRRGKEK